MKWMDSKGLKCIVGHFNIIMMYGFNKSLKRFQLVVHAVTSCGWEKTCG
jgi:hypothetical protein